MSKLNEELRKLLEDIYQTQNYEIQCDDAADLMAQAAYAKLTEAHSRRQYPELWHHFHYCPECAGEYRMLLDMAHAEADGLLDFPDSIPPIPAMGENQERPSIVEQIVAAFTGFSAATAGAVRSGLPTAHTEPATIDLIPDLLFVELFIESTGTLRNLTVAVFAEDEQWEESLEGAVVNLQPTDADIILFTSPLNDLDEATFTNLQPDTYVVHLKIADQEFVITDVELP